MPNIGDKKTMTLKISNETLGYTAAGSASLEALLKKYLDKKLKGKVATFVGGKLLPGIGWATIISGICAFVNHTAGNDGVEIEVHLKYSKVTKHQGGGVITFEGWTLDFPGYSVSVY